MSIKQLQDDFRDIKNVCANLQKENTELKTQCNNLELYSRKNNIIFHGIDEQQNESHGQCNAAVRAFFADKLKIIRTKVDTMQFVRIHRLRAMKQNAPRDIIVRFRDYRDREAVWGQKSVLAGDKKLGISEDFPKDIAYKRRKLYPIFHAAKRANKRVSLKGDKLVIDGKTFTTRSLGDLEGTLHPSHFCEKSGDNVLVFGGLYSEWHTFSNWSPCKIDYVGKSFTTLEHAYLHKKAITFNDTVTASAILAASDAASAKTLSYSIRDVDVVKWDGMKEEVMKDLLQIKFAPGTAAAAELLATRNKSLAESGRDKFFSCGLSLTDKQILNTTKWGENALGRLLSDIRKDLCE